MTQCGCFSVIKAINSGEIVGCYVGEHSGKGAAGLWQSMPGVYRQWAVYYTDFWSAQSNAILHDLWERLLRRGKAKNQKLRRVALSFVGLTHSTKDQSVHRADCVGCDLRVLPEFPKRDDMSLRRVKILNFDSPRAQIIQ